MSENLDRRSAVTAAAAAGGLLLLGGSTSAAESDDPNPLTGEWFNGGKLDQPCAIFQQGRILLLVNEKGDIATGQMTEANRFRVIRGWSEEEAGRVIDRGRVIAWRGGGTWRRR
jgi:hypothetical protein